MPGAEKVMAVEPGREVKICSPFREDRNPSFSVWVNSDGVGFWKDHGTEEAGDEVQLLEKARGLSNVDAMKAYHDLAGVAWGKGGTGARKAAKARAAAGGGAAAGCAADGARGAWAGGCAGGGGCAAGAGAAGGSGCGVYLSGRCGCGGA